MLNAQSVLARRVLVVILALGLVSACDLTRSSGPDDPAASLLPPRTGELELFRITPEFRANGGVAFIILTGYPTPPVVDHLVSLGLQPPPGRDEVTTYPGLGLHSVAGFIPPEAFDAIAAVPWVVRIENAEDPDGIFPAA